MRKLSKRIGETIHFKRRALERLGIDLNRQERAEIIKIIQTSGGRTLVKSRSNRVSTHRVEYKNRVFKVVYDKLRHALVTILLYYR